jgi:transposase
MTPAQNRWMREKVFELHRKGMDSGVIAERLCVSRKYVTNVLRKQKADLGKEVDA